MDEAPTFRHTPASKAAIVMEDGRVVTYGELEMRANQGAHLLRRLGLQLGDVLAVCIENIPEFLDVVCAARRSGLTVVPISTRLTAPEAAFIVNDSQARALVVSPGIDAALAGLTALCPGLPILVVGGGAPGQRSWDDERQAQPSYPIKDEAPGGEMLYSSGTTGRPKGIHYRLAAGSQGATRSALNVLQRLGVNAESVYLSPAPLYHSAPFAWSLGVLALGGTIVVMARFDAEVALSLIERHKVDVSQWVPTHFVRMLKLPETVRRQYDMSSLKLAVHAAAPCPIPVKRAMLDWWGPILLEYFGSSEQTALTMITAEEWLERPGSVGRCVLGKLQICDDAGAPLPVGETGLVYSEGGMDFSYNGDPGKTAEAHNAEGWTTVGDIGRLDDEGYLYLVDRKSFTIISGGVNIYPQEIEDKLIAHPEVLDAAVVGAPDEDLGEVAAAFVSLVDPGRASPEFADELRRWLRGSLSSVKAPRYIEFRAELPRLPTGKMAKHSLRADIAEIVVSARKNA